MGYLLIIRTGRIFAIVGESEISDKLQVKGFFLVIARNKKQALIN
jgi:hypothetical protein